MAVLRSFLFWIAAPLSLFAAFEPLPPGAQALATACSQTGTAEGPQGSVLNPAAEMHGHALCISLYQPYGIRGLDAEQFTTVLKIKHGHLGFGCRAWGCSVYRETIFGITAGTSLGRFSAGFRCNFMHLDLGQYGSASCIGFDGGFLFRIPGNLSFGGAVFNIGKPELGMVREPIPVRFSIGAGHAPGIMRISAAVDVDSRMAGWKIGFELDPGPLVLRLGCSEKPRLLTGGFGVSFKSWTLDYGFGIHMLGTSHQISLTYCPKTRPEKESQ